MFLNKIFDLLKIFIFGLLDQFYIAGSSQCSLETHVGRKKFFAHFSPIYIIPNNFYFGRNVFEEILKKVTFWTRVR